jgi:hypothetical protein
MVMVNPSVTRHVLSAANMANARGILNICATVILVGLGWIVEPIVAATITAPAHQVCINVILVKITQWANFVKFVTLELLEMQLQKLDVSRVIVMGMLI